MHAAPARLPPHPAPAGPLTRRLATVLALLTAASAGYTIQPGDTLSGLAVRHGTSTRALAEANGIANPNRILAGTTLQIPGASGTTAGSHTVAPGETLSGIARRHGLRMADIAAANGIVDRNRILAGQRLTLPTGSGGGGDRAAAPARSSAPAATASRAEVGALIERTARAHGWNPAFVKALAWQESGWSNRVISPAGAIGIMQVIPDTGRFVSQRFAGRALDLHDPADNVLAGVLFLDYLHGTFGGDPELILAGYFQGPASVRRIGITPATRHYIANVLALRSRF